jgi:hypothetical protein
MSTSTASITQDGAGLAAALKQALQATVFTSSLRIAPRRIQQISHEIAAAFHEFQKERQDTAITYTYGRHLAQEGLGHDGILALIDVLHRACWESAGATASGLPASAQYCHPLLAGYMAGREAHLLQEQERTRLALERARTQAAP